MFLSTPVCYPPDKQQSEQSKILDKSRANTSTTQYLEKILQHSNLVKEVELIDIHKHCLVLSSDQYHLLVYNETKFMLFNNDLQQLKECHWNKVKIGVDIEDIQWSISGLELLILTGESLFKFNPLTFELNQIELNHSSGKHRFDSHFCYMTIDSDDNVLLNRDYGDSFEKYLLKTGQLIEQWTKSDIYGDHSKVFINQIYLNIQNNLLSMNVDVCGQGVIDLVDAKTMKLRKRMDLSDIHLAFLSNVGHYLFVASGLNWSRNIKIANYYLLSTSRGEMKKLKRDILNNRFICDLSLMNSNSCIILIENHVKKHQQLQLYKNTTKLS